MFDTHKLMRRLNDVNYDRIDLNDLITQFQTSETKNFEKSKIYANVFCRLFPLMFKLTRNFFNLTYEDRAELCSQVLLEAMNKYKGGKIKFITYFHTSLSNRLRTTISNQKLHKRCVMLHTDVCSDQVDHVMRVLSSRTKADAEREFLHDLIDSDGLSQIEKEYCACVLAGYGVGEIENKLNLSQRMKYNGTSNPIKVNKRLVANIKNGLKVKFKDKNFSKII